MAKCTSCKKDILTTNCPLCKKPICVFCADKHKRAHGIDTSKPAAPADQANKDKPK